MQSINFLLFFFFAISIVLFYWLTKCLKNFQERWYILANVWRRKFFGIYFEGISSVEKELKPIYNFDIQWIGLHHIFLDSFSEIWNYSIAIGGHGLICFGGGGGRGELENFFVSHKEKRRRNLMTTKGKNEKK